jgi:hypothetical protein
MKHIWAGLSIPAQTGFSLGLIAVFSQNCLDAFLDIAGARLVGFD